MSFILDKHQDQSVSLFIDGYLQFDSRDERIYHECIALPALALARKRFPATELHALICGGGDGLLVRELVKCHRIRRIDLVEIDEEILQLARLQLNDINNRSLDDARLRIYNFDAWDYLVKTSHSYHLLFCDLTVPQDAASTKMHSVEWYKMLSRVLAGPDGILAVNCASPCQTPAAYWSIVNSVRQAGWSSVRPYRTAIPSFSIAGYGLDWGFLLASNREISRHELVSLPLPEPRFQLKNTESLVRLFSFPSACAQHRFSAEPIACHNNDLLDKLNMIVENINVTDEDWNCLDSDFDRQILPDYPPRPDTDEHVIPKAIKSFFLSPAISDSDDEDTEEDIFCRIAEILPPLATEHTRAMVAEFISFPKRFLESIDLPGLINALLDRAGELPKALIGELIYLKRHLPEIDLSALSLERIGLRILAIIALIVILSNLASPETAYAKSSVFYHQPAIYQGPTVQFPQAGFVVGQGYKLSELGKSFYTDINGNIYPERYFKLHSSQFYTNLLTGKQIAETTAKLAVIYRLSPNTFVMENGYISAEVAPNTGLLFGQAVNTLVNLHNGHPLLQVAPDPVEKANMAAQLDSQINLLEQTLQQTESQTAWMSSLGFSGNLPNNTTEIVNLSTVATLLHNARTSLGETTETAAVTEPSAPAAMQPSAPAAMQPSAPAAMQPSAPVAVTPTAATYQLLPSVWGNREGSHVIIHLPDRGYVYMNGRHWYQDADMTGPLDLAYPHAFRKFLIGYLKNYLINIQTIVQEQQQSESEIQSHFDSLMAQRSSYEQQLSLASENKPAGDESIWYGPEQIPIHQALAHLDTEIKQTMDNLATIRRHLSTLTEEMPAFSNLLQHLRKKD